MTTRNTPTSRPHPTSRRGGLRALLGEMSAEIRAHRSTALVYVTLRVLVIVMMVLQFPQRQL